MVGKYSLSKAVFNKAGEDKAAWAKTTRSADVVVPAAALQYSVMEMRLALIAVMTLACNVAEVCATGAVKSKCLNQDSDVW